MFTCVKMCIFLTMFTSIQNLPSEVYLGDLFSPRTQCSETKMKIWGAKSHLHVLVSTAQS